MKINWGYVFAGISALAGVIYVTRGGNQPQVVTNNFAPIGGFSSDMENGGSSNSNQPQVVNNYPQFVSNNYPPFGGVSSDTENGIDNATVTPPQQQTPSQSTNKTPQIVQPVWIV